MLYRNFNRKIKRQYRYIGAGVALLLLGQPAITCQAAGNIGGMLESFKEAVESTAEKAVGSVENSSAAEGESDTATAQDGSDSAAAQDGSDTAAAQDRSDTAAAQDSLEEVDAQKAETVFVVADASGEKQEVLVSDWLKNIQKEETLTDRTFLQDIENLKGNETFTEDGAGQIVWNAEGNDIFYRGTTDEDLPVSVHVTYMLDGVEMSPEEIAGKTGEVTIRCTYQNELSKEIEIGGEKCELHVPFAVVTGFLLDENVLTDIEITNGRLISDGDHLAAVGLAFPGIAEDLNTPAYASLSKLIKSEVPDYIEIKAHAENFTFNTSYTIITNELFSGEKTDINSIIDEVSGKVASLKNGVGQIVDGITSLKEGAVTLKEGTSAMAKGLKDLTSQNETLKSSGLQIFKAILSQVQTQLEQAGIEGISLDVYNYAEVLDTLIEEAEKSEDPDGQEKAAMLTAAREQLDGCREFYEGLVAYTDGAAALEESAGQIKTGADSLESGAAQLALETSLIKAVLPDLSGIPEAIKETVNLAEEYNTFTGISDEMQGKVRFIWKIEGVK